MHTKFSENLRESPQLCCQIGEGRVLLIRGGLPVGTMGFAKDADDTEGHGMIWENGYASSVLYAWLRLKQCHWVSIS